VFHVLQYYLGVAQQLQEAGILTDSSQLAGASAGSLIVACIKAGLPFDDIRAACFELAR
jgi:predicted acylesterase/phospholipase RssA